MAHLVGFAGVVGLAAPAVVDLQDALEQVAASAAAVMCFVGDLVVALANSELLVRRLFAAEAASAAAEVVEYAEAAGCSVPDY